MADMLAGPRLDVKAFERQANLLHTFDQKLRDLDRLDPLVEAMDRHQQKAFDMLRSPKIRKAFDLSKEDPKVLDRYGYDEQNTVRQRRMLIHVGGGNPANGLVAGIHWHMNIAVDVRYIARDEKRQEIPWIEVRDKKTGRVTVYESSEKPLTVRGDADHLSPNGREGLGRQLAALSEIRLVAPPFDVPTMAETMFWHPRFTSDPAHRWLREQIAGAAAGV